MSAEFIAKYCGVPPAPPKPIPVTEQEIIDNFTSYIEQSCIETITIVKYKMPDKFFGRIAKPDFWSKIIWFLSCTMGFEDHDEGNWRPEFKHDRDYENLDFKFYYIITEKKEIWNDKEYILDYVAIRNYEIDKIVFKIYKS